MSLDLTHFHRENLAKLATFLEALPADYSHFRMAVYANNPRSGEIDVNDISQRDLNECGTSACAVGHGPAAGIPVSPDDRTWHGYEKRVFGVSLDDDYDTPSYDLWSRLFGPHHPDNPRAAAARIRNTLEALGD